MQMQLKRNSCKQLYGKNFGTWVLTVQEAKPNDATENGQGPT